MSDEASYEYGLLLTQADGSTDLYYPPNSNGLFHSSDVAERVLGGGLEQWRSVPGVPRGSLAEYVKVELVQRPIPPPPPWETVQSFIHPHACVAQFGKHDFTGDYGKWESRCIRCGIEQ